MPNTPYNLTALTAETGISGFMGAANDLSGGLFGTLILIVTFIIMAIAWRGEEPRKAYLASSFITVIVAIMLRLLGWIPDRTLFISILLTGLAFVLSRWS